MKKSVMEQFLQVRSNELTRPLWAVIRCMDYDIKLCDCPIQVLTCSTFFLLIFLKKKKKYFEITQLDYSIRAKIWYSKLASIQYFNLKYQMFNNFEAFVSVSKFGIQTPPPPFSAWLQSIYVKGDISHI